MQAQEAKPYLVGLPDTQLYPQYWNHEGKLDGYLPRILQRFAADTGIRWDLRALPIRRYYIEFGEDRLDFVAPSNSAWAEGKTFKAIIYSKPIMKSRAGLIGLTPQIDAARVKHITTLAGYTIPYGKGTQHFQPARVSFVNNVNSAMLLLSSQRTDLVYLHYDAALEWIRINASRSKDEKAPAKTQYAFYEEYSEEFDYCLATIRHPQIIEAFNAWLKKNPRILDEIKASLPTSRRYP